LNNLTKQAIVVQKSLSRLNIGQQAIFNVGMALNLGMAVTDVYTGKLTPGDFVLIQALFMQLAGPLFNLGSFFRQIDETGVDVEELFHMLNSKPMVKERVDSKEFEFKKGSIKI
jgi:ABC-type transport system involved in Fe-S cluster assembly fused permease/ATPase subunit